MLCGIQVRAVYMTSVRNDSLNGSFNVSTCIHGICYLMAGI